MVEQDHAVGDVFLETETRERVFTAFAGDNRSYAEGFQELKQPPNFRAQQCSVGEAGEQRLDRIQHYSLRADRLDRVLEPDEQPLEVVLAGLGNFVRVDMNVIDRQLALADKFIEIEIKRSGVDDQLVFGFLEGDENARFPIVADAVDEKFDGEHGLAASCAAANERRTSAREPA